MRIKWELNSLVKNYDIFNYNSKALEREIPFAKIEIFFQQIKSADCTP
jgi:hypothetical protein